LFIQQTLLSIFSPNNDVRLSTIKESPVLAAGGFQNDFEQSGNPVPTMEEWTFAYGCFIVTADMR
jgi:hypothetical protein